MGLIRFLMKSTMVAAAALGGYYLGTVKTGQQANITGTTSALEEALSRHKGTIEGKCILDATKSSGYTITFDYSRK